MDLLLWTRLGYGCSDAPYLHVEALLRTVSVFKKYSPLACTFPEYLLNAIQNMLLQFSFCDNIQIPVHIKDVQAFAHHTGHALPLEQLGTTLTHEDLPRYQHELKLLAGKYLELLCDSLCTILDFSGFHLKGFDLEDQQMKQRLHTSPIMDQQFQKQKLSNTAGRPLARDVHSESVKQDMSTFQSFTPDQSLDSKYLSQLGKLIFLDDTIGLKTKYLYFSNDQKLIRSVQNQLYFWVDFKKSLTKVS